MRSMVSSSPPAIARRYYRPVMPLDYVFGLPFRVLRLWNDTRTWLVRGEKIPPNAGLALPDSTSTALMRLLLEAGIALSPAKSYVDLAAWYPVFRYADAFASPGGELRLVASAATWEDRLLQAIGEELAVGTAIHVARAHLGVVHIADVAPLLDAGDLVIKSPPLSVKHPGARPDYLAELPNGESILIESKGAVGTRAKLTRAIAKGEIQVDNIDFVRPTPRQVAGAPCCDRLVIASHFCVANQHARSRSATIVIDPPAPDRPRDVPWAGSDLAVRVSYAKAFNLAGQAILARDLVDRRPLRLDGLPETTIGNRRLLGLGTFVLGGTLVIEAAVATALVQAELGDLRPHLERPLASVREIRPSDQPDLVLLNNGVGLLRSPPFLPWLWHG